MKTFTKLFLICNVTFTIYNSLTAQNIGINGSGATAHPSALLDVDAVSTPSLGILIPRIALQAINLAAPVNAPATSLLVYNTASASTGTNAVTAGYYYWDGAKWVRFAYNSSGNSSLNNDWNLLGNAGTVAGTNFLGTIDDVDLVFKRNNVRAGLLNVNNTSFGVGALNTVSTGTANTAIGNNALLKNIDGDRNVAIGYASLEDNTSGFSNIAIGHQSLLRNISGNNNVAIGLNSMFKITNTVANTSLGNITLKENTSGSWNTASGYAALRDNTAGSFNTAIGSNALDTNLTGGFNVGVGRSSLKNNTTGSYNTAIGAYAATTGTTLINGEYNTYLGAFTDALGTYTNATAIGYNAKVGQSNALILGGTGASAVNVGIGTTNPLTSLHIHSKQPSTSAHPYRNGLLVQAEGTDVGGRIGSLVTSTTEYPTISTHRARGTINTPSAVLANDVIGAFATGGYNGSAYTTSAAHLQMYANENWTPTANGTFMQFSVTQNGLPATSSSEVMRISGNNPSGVGTSSAQTVNIKNRIFFNEGDGTSANGPDFRFAQSGLLTADNNLIFNVDGLNASAGSVVWNKGSHSTTGVTELMRLTNAGRLGIGTNGPSSRLHIDGAPATNNGSVARVTGDYSEITTATDFHGLVVNFNSMPINKIATVDRYLIGCRVNLYATNGTDYMSGYLSARTNNSGSTLYTGVRGVIAGNSPNDDIVAAGYFSDGSNNVANTWALYTAGRTFATGSAWTASDRAFKKNITPITNALNELNKVNVYTYYFDETHKNAEALGLKSLKEKQYGVIAQELEAIFPEMVSQDGYGNKLVKYDALLPIAIKAIQEQQQQIEIQKTQNEQQQLLIEKLEKQNAEILELLKKK